MLTPDMPIAKLCMAGMTAEGEGDIAQAKRLYKEAWDVAGTDFERAVAAHYVARHQDDVHGELEWNRRALTAAQAVPDQSKAFMPSLLGSVGISLEKLGDKAEARRFLEEAKEHFHDLTDDAYGNHIRTLITKALVRLDLHPDQ